MGQRSFEEYVFLGGMFEGLNGDGYRSRMIRVAHVDDCCDNAGRKIHGPCVRLTMTDDGAHQISALFSDTEWAQLMAEWKEILHYPTEPDVQKQEVA